MPASGRFSASRIALPTYMLAMTPQTRSAFFSNSCGPGCRPNMISAPSMIAVVPEPGMPSANIGTIAPLAAALLAASGPATPSIAPVPNSSGCFDTFFSTAYAMNDAMVAPAPGSTPIRKPITVPRSTAKRLRMKSMRVGIRLRTVSSTLGGVSPCSTPASTSPMPNSATASTRKSMPSISHS